MQGLCRAPLFLCFALCLLLIAPVALLSHLSISFTLKDLDRLHIPSSLNPRRSRKMPIWSVARQALAPSIMRKLHAISRGRGKAKRRSTGRLPSSKIARQPRVAALGIRPFAFSRQTLPAELYRDFKFCYTNELGSGTTQGSFGTPNTFNLNDIYRCAAGGATVQPLYADQYEGLYSLFRVHAVTVTLTWTSNDTTHVLALAASFQSSYGTKTLSGQNAAYVGEMPLTSVIRMAPGGEHNYQQGPVRFTMKQLEGDNWLTHQKDYNGGMGSASPTISPTLQVAVCNFDTTTNALCRYYLEIVYHTKLFNRVIAAQSTS